MAINNGSYSWLTVTGVKISELTLELWSLIIAIELVCS